VSEAATALGVSATTVRRRITDGRLTARREPYRQAFRWLVLLPPEGAPGDTTAVTSAGASASDLAVDRLVVAVARETDDELRAIAAGVDLTRLAVVEILERQRTVALRQAALLEELASDPVVIEAEHAVGTQDTAQDTAPDTDRAAEGSRWALLISLAVCLAAVGAAVFLALPAWSTGIVGAVAVVSGLIAAVECFLVVTAWATALSARRKRPT